MVRIGIAGIGFMGVTHFRAAKGIEGGKVTAIFTRDPKKLEGDWRSVRGNFGDAGGLEDLSGIKRYRDLDEMIADPDLDMIDICLPTYLHADVAVKALLSGKHVLVEKPIALSLEDAERMIDASRSSGRKLMVAQVLRFFPQFAFIKEAIEDGRFGRFLGGHLKRVISRPTWGGDNWFDDPAKSGGPVIDLHIHDADFVQYMLGMPEKVFATGISKDGYVQYLVASYLYEGDGVCITAQSGAIAAQGRPFEHGYDMYFERATLQYNSSSVPNVLVITDEGEDRIDVGDRDGFMAEIQYAVDCIRFDREPELISGISARNSLLLCLKAAESVKTGEVVEVKG
jgi:predicted dehydrogenase